MRISPLNWPRVTWVLPPFFYIWPGHSYNQCQLCHWGSNTGRGNETSNVSPVMAKFTARERKGETGSEKGTEKGRVSLTWSLNGWNIRHEWVFRSRGDLNMQLPWQLRVPSAECHVKGAQRDKKSAIWCDWVELLCPNPNLTLDVCQCQCGLREDFYSLFSRSMTAGPVTRWLNKVYS